MIILDFVAEKTYVQLADWSYSQIMGFIVEFLGMIYNTGAELFDFVWAKAIVVFFNYLAWIMFTLGLILTVFETTIALFKLSISMQVSLSLGLTKLTNKVASIGEMALTSLSIIYKMFVCLVFGIFLLIAIEYSGIKVFFNNLQRSGSLLTRIAVGRLYMISVPRRYIDGFTVWSKQIIALSLTTLQPEVI